MEDRERDGDRLKYRERDRLKDRVREGLKYYDNSELREEMKAEFLCLDL